jgi:hypothetical protein
MSDATAPELPNALWDRRWRLAGLAGVILVALAVFVEVVAPPWRWTLFWWGVAIGVAASVLIGAIGHRATGGDNVSVAERLRIRRQLVIYAALWVLMGVMLGSGAAIADAAWLDFVLVALLAIQALIVALVASRLRRVNG